ncbi:unnamed protein product [Rangifer tarandus platyrhynchus]|uniref:Uncharacterized protein n=2 Tax=Rangifer tarandus platyrhynchus TaxID=3082113 RepID=A0ABN8ZUD8_RANTA|nr:unnamed protein product [Rangifer tarandus platyrhynchus]CAI9711932.1 unnamed protein product [Rangifer tarandus platyrhynchus]
MAPLRLRPRTPALETPPLRGLCVFPAPSWKWDCAASCWRSRWDCAGKPVSFYAGSRERGGGVLRGTTKVPDAKKSGGVETRSPSHAASASGTQPRAPAFRTPGPGSVVVSRRQRTTPARTPPSPRASRELPYLLPRSRPLPQELFLPSPRCPRSSPSPTYPASPGSPPDPTRELRLQLQEPPAPASGPGNSSSRLQEPLGLGSSALPPLRLREARAGELFTTSQTLSPLSAA